jgi:hypothetical protein
MAGEREHPCAGDDITVVVIDSRRDASTNTLMRRIIQAYETAAYNLDARQCSTLRIRWSTG